MKAKSIAAGVVFGTVFMIIIPFVLYRLNTLLGLLYVNTEYLRYLGVILIATGVFLFLYCGYIFNKLGKGTPAPIEPPKKLVDSGIYSLTRNPIYVGYIALLFGEFLLSGSVLLLFYALAIFFVINAYTMRIEEPILKKRFGGEYIEYMKKVPRW